MEADRVLPPELRSQPVLNCYSMGGPLILSASAYVDGRGDMYGDLLVVDYGDIAHGNVAPFERRQFGAGISGGRSCPTTQKRFIAMLR